VKDHCYFELELTDVDPDVDVSIGFVTKEGYHQNVDPGTTEHGFSYHAINGAVMHDKKLKVQYDFTALFGETIGLGYRFDDGRVWLFYNGKFLNEPEETKKSKSPKKKAKSPVKKTTEGESPTEENKEEEEQQKEQVLAKEGKIELKSEHYYPAVSANGNCTVTLNIGGAPFRIYHKEIAKGLL